VDESASSALERHLPAKGENMKKRTNSSTLPEGHLQRYDWSKATRGRLAVKATKASALLRLLDADLAVSFPDSRSVNEALRALLALDEALPRRRLRKRQAA
jgi:hypothetical protein